jgi:hypothetical protein
MDDDNAMPHNSLYSSDEIMTPDDVIGLEVIFR